MKKLLSILIVLFLFISCKELPEREISGKCRSKVEIINNDIRRREINGKRRIESKLGSYFTLVSEGGSLHSSENRTSAN
jgi:hypothetical protein